MIPGMGLTSYLYLGTPDGRDGWAPLFAKAGYPVYVFDEPNNAVSGFDVFGDHFDTRPMAGRHQACETTAKLITEAGGTADVIWLPKLGIKGNTHLLMQDTNNDEIARMIMAKLAD